MEGYAEDDEAFFKDSAEMLCKLFELGIPFTTAEEGRFRFKPLAGAA